MTVADEKDNPDWLKAHKDLYGDPWAAKPPRQLPPPKAENPQLEALAQSAAKELAIKILLADVASHQFYYARKMVLPRFRQGHNRLDGV